MHRIVIQDPLRELKPGTIVEGENTIVRLVNRGVAMLPVDQEWCRRGVDGFMVRRWGNGWLFDLARGQRGCGMVLRVDPARPYVYWAVRVVPVDSMRPAVGQLKFTTDTTHGENSAGLGNEVRPPRIEDAPPARDGSRLLGGRMRLGSAGLGYLGVSIYGTAQNALIEWSAVSQATEQADLATCLP